MSYEQLCDDVMLLTHHIVAAIVEHKDGHSVSQRERKEIVEMLAPDNASESNLWLVNIYFPL